jgi:tetrahydromethanopterin S-methyltransferase subunit E
VGHQFQHELRLSCLATLAYLLLDLSNREICGFCSISRTCRVFQISFLSVRRFPRPFTLPVVAVCYCLNNYFLGVSFHDVEVEVEAALEALRTFCRNTKIDKH